MIELINRKTEKPDCITDKHSIFTGDKPSSSKDNDSSIVI